MNTFFKTLKQSHRWFIWAISALFLFLQFGFQLSSGSILQELMRSFTLTPFGAGMLTSTYYYIYVLLQTPGGLLMDVHGPRKLLSTGALFCAAGCFVFANADVAWLAGVGRIMMGTGAAFAFIGCLTLISRWFSPEKFSFLLGIFESLGMLSGLCIGVGAASAVQHFGWRSSFWTAGEIAIVLSLLLWLVIRDSPKPEPKHFFKKKFPWQDMKRLLKDHRAWLNGIYSGILFSIMTVFATMWLIPYFILVYHLDLTDAAFCSNLIFLGLVAGCPLIGWMDQRFRCRRTVLALCPLIAMVILCIVIYCTLSLVLLQILMVILGLFASAYMIPFAVGHQLGTEQTKSASIGFVNTLSVGLTPILQPIVGYLIVRFSNHDVATMGAYHRAFFIIPIILVLATIFSFFIPNKKI